MTEMKPVRANSPFSMTESRMTESVMLESEIFQMSTSMDFRDDDLPAVCYCFETSDGALSFEIAMEPPRKMKARRKTVTLIQERPKSRYEQNGACCTS